jgi:hypothetical protein
MDADDGLRLDYEQTTQFLRTLVDVRFKLLAFVPTITGAAVGLVGRPRPAAELLGVGLLGLLATLGIFLYELRNTQLHDALVRRAAELERQLGLRPALGASGPGGLFGELPGRAVRLFGVLPVGQDRGLALVYSTALAGWAYLTAWGAFGAVELGEARTTGAAIGVAVGVLVLAEVERIYRRSADKSSPPARRSRSA